MIITRTPFRISFFGGGTDYPVWYEDNGGAVLSTTINKYCYISCRYLPPFFNFNYLIRYAKREEKSHISDIKHPSVRECLKFLKIKKGIEMVHTSDIPARSGIGSSSAFTVGFLNALHALTGRMVTKRQLARDSIYLEQKILKENVGSQDQIAVAFGGLNKIEFGPGEKFYVNPITISSKRKELFQKHLMLFFTGFCRNASKIAREQIKNTKAKTNELQTMKDMVEEAEKILYSKRHNSLNDFGKLLHESWQLKRSLSKLISMKRIDDIYETAIRAGALGGKLLGAGGGGFMLISALPQDQPRIKEKLKKLLYVPFDFETLGSQIVLYAT